MTRQPFLKFFALLLAIVAGLTMALWLGVPEAVWRADQSMMTSATGNAATERGDSDWRGIH